MNAMQNKQLLRDIFDALARGESKPFVDALADDVRWTITGSTAWSRTYDGKATVQGELLTPLFAQFAERYTNRAERIHADGDHVVVEARGRTTTWDGQPYENTYCYVFRLDGGRIVEITEYCDTQLVATALRPPAMSLQAGAGL